MSDKFRGKSEQGLYGDVMPVLPVGCGKEKVPVLKAMGEQAREELGDNITGRIGKNVRPCGVVR